jgi:hypothetical protein
MSVCECVCMFEHSSRTDVHQTWHAYFLWPESDFRMVKTPEKVPSVRVPARVIPVAQKLGMMQERRQDESCWLQREYYRNEGQNPENVSCVRVPMKVLSVARKISTIEERGQDQSFFLFRRGYYRNRGHNNENLSWVRVPVRMLLWLGN